MMTATEYALAPFAALGLVTIVSKLHDTFKYFTHTQGGVLPSCYGDCQIGAAWGERGCADCPHWSRCSQDTSNRRLTAEVTSIRPSDKPKLDVCGGTFGGHPDKSIASDTWPKLHDGGIVDTHLGKIELVQHVTGKVLKTHPLFTAETHAGPVEPLWTKKDCYATEQDEMLRHHVPNIGGEGNVPYAGPNYVSDEALADEMKGILHYFDDERETGYFDEPTRIEHKMGGDLAWDYQGFGLVAADGAIWVAFDERVHTGIVLMQASEMGKAARFGWTYERECKGDARHVWVRREMPL